VPAEWPWTSPILTARQSAPLERKKAAASAGSVSAPLVVCAATSSSPSARPSSASTVIPRGRSSCATAAEKDRFCSWGRREPSAITASTPGTAACSISLRVAGVVELAPKFLYARLQRDLRRMDRRYVLGRFAPATRWPVRPAVTVDARPTLSGCA
jgi:hypothetical protein